MALLEVDRLTRVYPGGGGIFEVSFSVDAGEILGCLGAEGTGKTTLFRHLMGFVRAQQGSCQIGGFDCWRFPSKVQQLVGYLPEWTADMEWMTGIEFLMFCARYRGLESQQMMRLLLDRLDVNPNYELRRMPAAMRRKLAIVCALMHDPAVLLLDGPTDGLEAEDQKRVLELIQEEKIHGKAILLASRDRSLASFCDRSFTLQEGYLVPMAEGDTHGQGKGARS